MKKSRRLFANIFKTIELRRGKNNVRILTDEKMFSFSKYGMVGSIQYEKLVYP